MVKQQGHPQLDGQPFVDDGGPDLWDLQRRRTWIDERQVLTAMRRTLAREGGAIDYRTELLLHDMAEAMRARGHSLPFACPDPRSVEEPDEIGFPSLASRLMTPVTPEVLETMFRLLGREVRRPVTLTVGGSVALTLRQLLSRETDDVDVVDELPPEIRNDHAVLNGLVDRFGLRLTHFGSHYLPEGWVNRTASHGVFGNVSVRLVDTYDLLADKVFSKRPKDQKDLDVVLPQVDRDVLANRIAHGTRMLRKVPGLEVIAAKNWYVLTGEETLPEAP